MKKNKQETKPPTEGRAAGGDTYFAPPPPSKGRIIGLDCHPDTFTAAVLKGSNVYDVTKLSSRPDMSLEKLLKWAQKNFTHEDLFLLEAGSNSFEVCRRLHALGLRAIVLESAYVGQRAKKYADNDKMAAERIAMVYLGGKAPCVWQPDAITCERRELLHLYSKAVADHVAASNSLKGYLNQSAVRPGQRGLHLKRTQDWILAQREWSPLQLKLLEAYFSDLARVLERRKSLTRLIASEVSAEPLMLRCMKLLGIGMINAFALLAIIGDVRRFDRPEKLVAYLGLNPGQRDSGTGKRVKLGMGKRGRGDMRHLLIQGAQAVLRMGRETTLGKWGWKLFARKGNRNVAVAAVARKMAVQVWHLLAGNPPEALEQDKVITLKLQKLCVMLGKSQRANLAMPSRLNDCVTELHARIHQATQLSIAT